MQVQSINIHSNQPSFRSVSKHKYIEWNKEQDSIASQITDLMKKPMEQYGGNTAENYYESIGYDFRILPHDVDSVYLTARKNSKNNKKYPYFVNIGIYSKEKAFDINDLDSNITPESFKDKAAMYGLIMLPVALIAGVAFTLTNKLIKAQRVSKPLIETVDSTIQNKVDTLKPDSINTVKAFKLIKK